MARLLLGAALLGNLGLCITAPVLVTLAPPAQVRFHSVDYKNILHWSPPTNDTSLRYYVQWKIYGEPEWLDADECQGTQKPECDLSVVTSDLREWYYARVHVSLPPSSKSAWVLSPRFSPRWDTKLSPPALKLNVTQQKVVVRVKSPHMLVRKMHNKLHYKIFLIHTSGKEDVYDMESHRMTLKALSHKVEYCLQAQTVVPSQAKSSARSPKQCVTMH